MSPTQHNFKTKLRNKAFSLYAHDMTKRKINKYYLYVIFDESSGVDEIF